MQVNANRDIWLEVLAYLKISLSDDSSEAIQSKRATLLSVSLTCTELVDIGLDALWESMETIEPVSTVFTPGIQYRETEDHAFWVRAPLNRPNANPILNNGQDVSESIQNLDFSLPRVQDYLSRIRFLHFSTFPSFKELALWVLLLGLGRLSCLCPNLKGLFLGLDESTPNAIYNLYPLLNPSMKSISLTSIGDLPTDAAASTLLAVLHRLGASVETIVYGGAISSLTFHHLFKFSSLRSVTISPHLNQNAVLDETQVLAFPLIHNLSTLDISLSVVAQDALPALGLWLSHVASLNTLRAVGSWTSIRNFLIKSGITFTSLRSLSLSFYFTEDPSTLSTEDRIDPRLFEIISQIFPNLNAVYIANKNWFKDAWRRAITMQDILDLDGRRIETLMLHSVRANFDPSSIPSIINQWYQLKSLSITPPPKPLRYSFHAYPALLHVSQHGRQIHHLSLPLHLSSITDTSVLNHLPPVCPLQRLELNHHINLPNDLENQLRLIKNLTILFPKLTVIASANTTVATLATMINLEKILHFTQEILSISRQKQVSAL